MSKLLYNSVVLGVVVLVVAATVAQETTTDAQTDTTTLETTVMPTVTDSTDGSATTVSQDDGITDATFNVWEFARFGGSGTIRRRPTLLTTPPPPPTVTTLAPAPQPAADTVVTINNSPALDPVPSPTYSPCFWAIVLCCGADVPHEREGCFEEAKCPGAWIGNLCSEKLKAKVRRRLTFG
ncbi:uncharacterized protein LOC143029746 [Oratosquilla oratoria]|uniref:uncharacterized protein LOC143029746 n=1 Tax=Oratosquilla oratoria TaxID=337810 RepID=UPI003F773DAB